MDLFDWGMSRSLRDEGADRALTPEEQWRRRAMDLIRGLPSGWSGIGEDIRRMVMETVGTPHHFNCWGALILGALRSGHLVKTGEVRSSALVTSHAHVNPVLARP